MDEDLIIRVEAHKIGRVLKRCSFQRIAELLREHFHANDRVGGVVDILLQEEVINDVVEDAQNIVNLFPELEFDAVVNELSEIEPSSMRAQQYLRRFIQRKRNLNNDADQNEEPYIKRCKYNDYSVASTSTVTSNQNYDYSEQQIGIPSFFDPFPLPYPTMLTNVSDSNPTVQKNDLPSTVTHPDLLSVKQEIDLSFPITHEDVISTIQQANTPSTIVLNDPMFSNLFEYSNDSEDNILPTKTTSVKTSRKSGPNSARRKPTDTKETENVIVIPDEDQHSNDTFIVESVIGASMTDSAAAASSSDGSNSSTNSKLVLQVLAMFPAADPQFIRDHCRNNNIKNIEDVIDYLLNNDYPQREEKRPSPPPRPQNPEEQLEMLKSLLPDADPTFLQEKVGEVLSEDQLRELVDNCLETKSYPKMKDYLRKQQISAQQKQYTVEFSVENFLKIIPDPNVHFNDPKRTPALNAKSNTGDIFFAKMFLRNLFNQYRAREVDDALYKSKNNVVEAAGKIRMCTMMSSKRKPYSLDSSVIQNIPLLQEVAWLAHSADILAHLKKLEVKRQVKFLAAKTANELLTCGCCYDEEVMEEESATCESGCIFCKNCIAKSAEVAVGDNKLQFPCLGDCGSHFSMQTLQAVLKPSIFSRMAQKKQLEEIKSAGLEDLEMCPFCDFATIPVTADRVFKCLNPECMKESCRLCHEPSHVPLRCDEVEKEDEVKQRTYIENKMTEALIRKCWKCQVKFIKYDGCNKMTCSCGAKMCYICLEPVTNYEHFNGQGGDKHHLCPLYSDTNLLHEKEVLRGAKAAKVDLGVDPHQLKHDPTRELNEERIHKAAEAEDKARRRMARNQHHHHHHHVLPPHQREHPAMTAVFQLAVQELHQRMGQQPMIAHLPQRRVVAQHPQRRRRVAAAAGAPAPAVAPAPLHGFGADGFFEEDSDDQEQWI